MSVIKSGVTSDQWTIDPTSKAGRVTLYDSLGREISSQSKKTFAVSGTFTPPATPTDLVTIFGSASKTVRVLYFKIATTNTAAGSQQFFLVKRSAVNSGGTFVAGTAVPMDSADGAATATSYGHYTANAASLGASAGTINTKRVGSPAAVPGAFLQGVDASVDMIDFNKANSLEKPVVLNGVAQGLALNFNSAALVAGQTHAYTIVWTEE